MINKRIYYIIVFSLILTLILGGIIFYQKNNQELQVIFLDVGQGDAILIKQGTNQMIIDGGRDGKLILEKLGKYIPFWDREIEIVMATHPDQDHIGGLPAVLKSYKVHTIMKTGAQSDSQTFKVFKESIKEEKAENIAAVKGISIKFSNGAEAEILYPLNDVNNENMKDSNASSVVMKLNFGENNFLFTGDLPSEKESALINDGTNISANILKVAHHGSKYSSSEEFLNSVNPEEAIISVGKNNSYGHPAPEILERILKGGARIFRTDEMGDITYKCQSSNFKCQMAN